MERYDFGKIVDRRGTGALKIDALQERYGNAGLLPLWVADMDFETPSFIIRALRQRLEHPLFGYTVEPEEYRTAVIEWIASHHGWRVEPEWLSYIPGIMKGIGMAVNVFVKEDEKVIIQPPVYHPFRITPQENGREVVYNPLRENEDGSYSMDFENLETVADGKCRMLILSNPHNPGGVVWDRETLIRLAIFVTAVASLSSPTRYIAIWRCGATGTFRSPRSPRRLPHAALLSGHLPRHSISPVSSVPMPSFLTEIYAIVSSDG